MRPTLRTVLLVALGIPVALLPVLVDPRLWTVWLAYIGATLVFAGVDGVMSVPRRRLKIEVEVPDTLYIGDGDPMTVTLSAPGWQRDVRAEIVSDLDEDLEPQPPVWATVPAGARARVPIPLSPRRRGAVGVHKVWVRWTGGLGLVRRQATHLVGRKVSVVPNTRAVRAAALRFFSSREFLAGLKVERYIGDGSEFESLKEYMPGLDHRAINWKASARHRKLLCEEFRAERNHQVVLAHDTGQLMSEPLEGIPRLDHAVNAGLLLSYFCLKTGDRVGYYGFDEKVRVFSEPEGGVHAFLRLQKLSSSFAYNHTETNFTLGLAELSARLRRRSLVVLLTEFVDTVTAELMIENLGRLARRHVVIFVTLRDPGLDAIVDRPPRLLSDVYEATVAAEIAREREVVLKRLRRLGVHCIDVPPNHVSVHLLNRYLDIKRRELV